MKKIFIFFIATAILSVAFLFLNKNLFNSNYFKLTGSVTETESYCDGAAPSPNLLDKLREPKPIEDKVIYIKKGNINDLDSDYVKKVITDNEGNFSLNLIPGTYCLLEEDKLSLPVVEKYIPSNLYEVDVQCLRSQWKICDKVVELNSNSHVDINYHQNCSFNKKCTYCKEEFAPCPIPQ